MSAALLERWRGRLLALLRSAEGTRARGREGAKSQGSVDVGKAAESQALAHLQSAGLTLLARNFLARGGELDLVMRDGDCVVFVEVRLRSRDAHGDGLDSVSASKQKRLIRAARQFLADHPKYARRITRFDVVALGAGGLRWVRNAFVLDGADW